MPRGGPRPNSGRPTKAQAAEKARLLAETIKRGPQALPRQYLQALLDSPGSTKSERLRAAELLLKLPPEEPVATVAPATPPVILSIPRGCFLSAEQAADPDQLIPHGVPIEPFTATPGTDPTRRANGSMRFLVSVRRWPRLWSPALLIRGRSDQEETSRPGSGSCRSNTRAAARTSSAVSASKAIATCVVCSPPARWP